MATVSLVKDVRHKRNVALKVLKPELAAVVGAERFRAEIETTANLQHPHIFPLFDREEASEDSPRMPVVAAACRDIGTKPRSRRPEISAASHIPTHAEFIGACETEFSFLRDYGFQRVQPPAHRRRNPYQVWFSKGPLNLVILGEMHGTSGYVLFETEDRQAAEIYFTPKDQRPPRKRRRSSAGQLELIAAAARRVQLHCIDLLEGDLERFNVVSEPLPPYLRPS